MGNITQHGKAALLCRLLTTKPALLIGDFNSNTIWDRKCRESNHSNVVKLLEEKGILSTYHLYHKQIQGKEQHPRYTCTATRMLHNAHQGLLFCFG